MPTSVIKFDSCKHFSAMSQHGSKTLCRYVETDSGSQKRHGGMSPTEGCNRKGFPMISVFVYFLLGVLNLHMSWNDSRNSDTSDAIIVLTVIWNEINWLTAIAHSSFIFTTTRRLNESYAAIELLRRTLLPGLVGDALAPSFHMVAMIWLCWSCSGTSLTTQSFLTVRETSCRHLR
jgi:hypothetical protein